VTGSGARMVDNCCSDTDLGPGVVAVVAVVADFDIVNVSVEASSSPSCSAPVGLGTYQSHSRSGTRHSTYC
jgi:hypothetical protein